MRGHSIAGLMRLVLLVAVTSAVLRSHGVPGFVWLLLLLLCIGVALLYVLVFVALVRCVKEAASGPVPPSPDA